jgi:hypothetical protein
MTIYRIFLILCFILASCKKENEAYNITISGIVTDQVTGQPIEGATVSLGNQGIGSQSDELINPIQTTSTGLDGRYKFKTSAMKYIPGSVSVGSYRSYCIAIVASKSGYIGSNRQEISYYDAHNSVLDLKLYHSSELDLHIKNDTANSIDAVDIRLIKSYNYVTFYSISSYYLLPVLTLYCNKRNLDSTYVVKNLFGNWEYSILVLRPGGQLFSPEIKYSISPKPDIINSFDISF